MILINCANNCDRTVSCIRPAVIDDGMESPSTIKLFYYGMLSNVVLWVFALNICYTPHSSLHHASQTHTLHMLILPIDYREFASINRTVVECHQM